MKKVFIILIIPLFLLAKAVKLDDVLTEDGQIQSDISMKYINIQNSSGQLGLIEYQTGNGDFVSIPTYVGHSKSQTDRINYGLNLKYGVTKNLELFTFSNFYSSTERNMDSSGTNSKSKSGFGSFGIGTTYQIKPEDETPSLLIGGTIDIFERDEILKYNAPLKSGSLFITTFYTADPIVFMLKGAYGHNLTHSHNNSKLDIGNTFTLAPQIYFAVNPYTSLSWGVRYQHRQRDKLDGVNLSNDQSQLGYMFGVSYEINKKSFLSIDIEHTNAPSYSQDSAGASFVHKF